MIFYVALDENGHRQIRGTQADARAVNKQFEQIDLPTDKAGYMAFVQKLFTEIDGSAPVEGPEQDIQQVNGAESSEPVPAQAHVVSPAQTYVAWSIKMDEVFPTLPLAHQLHFAAMAMENARSLVTRPIEAEPEAATV